MRDMTSTMPVSEIESVTEVLHGVSVTDPYRWLEDQDSERTRAWIDGQTRYARAYFATIPGREQIRKRVEEFLAVETYDTLLKASGRYFFRKRYSEQEQPCIYMRQGPQGRDQLLLDPGQFGTNIYTAVKPLGVSGDGRHLLYEIKQGGERSGIFSILDVDARRTLAERLPRGYLRGFAFSHDGMGFYYVHEAADQQTSRGCAVYFHRFGSNHADDHEVFRPAADSALRLSLVSDSKSIGFLVYRCGSVVETSFFIRAFDAEGEPECVIENSKWMFAPRVHQGRIFALTGREAANFKIVELVRKGPGRYEWKDRIPEGSGRISQWLLAGDHIVLASVVQGRTRVDVFGLAGNRLDEFVSSGEETIRLAGASLDDQEIFFTVESFTRPVAIAGHCLSGRDNVWAPRKLAFDSSRFSHVEERFPSKDGAEVPIFLVGRPDVLANRCLPTVMTSYGGYGTSVTPQFSVLATLLMEYGCLFAVPRIRGGSEFGAAWHEAARRRKRQTAFDDFLSAAQWLVDTGRTKAGRLAIFGGSNSGLLVAAAMTQRPDLFRAVLCLCPLTDMLRYHLFDHADLWRAEFGTSDDPQDFKALAGYSPYHQIVDGTSYPATMIVSGDADQNCNALHARKITARLQAATCSGHPIVLDYSRFRGHSPVLPLTERIEALTDRIAFLRQELGLN
jgi:prolyl oligopeptidase